MIDQRDGAGKPRIGRLHHPHTYQVLKKPGNILEDLYVFVINPIGIEMHDVVTDFSY
jgi:glycyl-tRNA synthetase alpha subunit